MTPEQLFNQSLRRDYAERVLFLYAISARDRLLTPGSIVDLAAWRRLFRLPEKHPQGSGRPVD